MIRLLVMSITSNDKLIITETGGSSDQTSDNIWNTAAVDDNNNATDRSEAQCQCDQSQDNLLTDNCGLSHSTVQWWHDHACHTPASTGIMLASTTMPIVTVTSPRTGTFYIPDSKWFSRVVTVSFNFKLLIKSVFCSKTVVVAVSCFCKNFMFCK